MENQNENTVVQTESTNPDLKETSASSVKPGVKKTYIKKVILAAILLVVVVVGIVSVMAVNTRIDEKNEDKKLVEQNERLKSFPPATETAPGEQESVDMRKKVLAYAQKNNITVTEEEIAAEKQEIIKKNGEDKVKKTIASYKWTEEDWTEVMRWQLLREKILRFAQPGRQGETISIRWDIFAPKLTQEYADQKMPLATQYLKILKQKLENKEISNLYEVFSTFDVRKEPLFAGKVGQYGMQYSGWDDEGKKFKDYLVTPDSTVYNDIYSQKVPSVSEPICNIGGCQIYNVVSGTNGDGEASEVIDILTKQKLYF